MSIPNPKPRRNLIELAGQPSPLQVAEFVIGPRHRQTFIQVSRGDLLCLTSHSLHGFERPACQPIAHQARDRQHDWQSESRRPRQLLHIRKIGFLAIAEPNDQGKSKPSSVCSKLARQLTRVPSASLAERT